MHTICQKTPILIEVQQKEQLYAKNLNRVEEEALEYLSSDNNRFRMANGISDIKCPNIKDIGDTYKLIIQGQYYNKKILKGQLAQTG